MSTLSQFSGATPLWVTGTTYNQGFKVTSPTDWQEYVRITNGAGATDPSADSTNWRPSVARPIKSIQRGSALITSGTASVDVTISAVVLAKSELVMLGFTEGGGITDNSGVPYLQFTSTTNVRATKQGASVGSFTYFGWQVTEYY